MLVLRAQQKWTEALCQAFLQQSRTVLEKRWDKVCESALSSGLWERLFAKTVW
jgi:hypothetical protein